MINEPLYVISVVSNTRRYKSRAKLFHDFQNYMEKNPVIQFYTVELAFGDRSFEFTSHNNPHHIQLRTTDELWLKENMINIGVSRLPIDWKYVAWIDGDIHFARHDWAEETIQMLQHHAVVQPWAMAVDLGPNHEVVKTHYSFAHQYQLHKAEMTNDTSFTQTQSEGYSEYAHAGFAWAMRRDAWNAVGGLLDFCIIGSADHHMAWSFIGEADRSIHRQIGLDYAKAIKQWELHCINNLKGDVGYVNGTIMHFWHGKKKDRRYNERWEVLINNEFNPLADIKRDWQGLWQLAGNKPKLRDDLRHYFQQRNEDSIDL